MRTRTAQHPAQAKPRGPADSNRLFAAGARAGLSEHERSFGPMPQDGVASSLREELELAGLTGRGGAAFESWRKLESAAASHGRTLLSGRPVVIANGAEGEPLSFKDKSLLIHAPHLVIDGLQAVGRALSSSRLFLYATAEALDDVERALAERKDAERKDTDRIEVIVAPRKFISGEASAVVNQIANGIAVPLDRRGPLSESGFKGRPTLVLNVETLAHIALIVRFGPEWFRSQGSVRDPGTRLVSLTGSGIEQVLEVSGDIRLGDVLAGAGLPRSSGGAILVGGYHGRWVTSMEMNLTPHGPVETTVRPGAGVIHLLPPGHCGLAATAEIVNYLAGESARQCGPCMFGLPAMAAVLTSMASGERNPHLAAELGRLGGLVDGRGACHHPDGTIQLIASALRVFAEDVQAHRDGSCLQGVVRTP